MQRSMVLRLGLISLGGIKENVFYWRICFVYSEYLNRRRPIVGVRDGQEEGRLREMCEFGWSLVYVCVSTQVWVFGQAGGGNHTVSENLIILADFGFI